MARIEYLSGMINKIVSVYLSNGTLLKGKLMEYDDKCIIVDKCLIPEGSYISIKTNE